MPIHEDLNGMEIMVQRLGFSLRDHPPRQRATFAELADLEPALVRLSIEVWNYRQRHRPDSAERLRMWSHRWKPELSRFVGWERPTYHPVLFTSTTYEVAYEFLADVWKL